MTRLLRRLFRLDGLHDQLLEAGEERPPPFDWASADILDRCFGPDPARREEAS